MDKDTKYWRDKHVLETQGHKLLPYPDDTPAQAYSRKMTAVNLAGVDPENYDKITQPEILGHIEDFKDSYETIQEILDYWMDLPEGSRKLIAIWIMGTYLHSAFPSYPYLFINAMRGSGKTRLLKLISHLAREGKGMVSTEPTESVIFRTPKHNTLVFDEFEGIGNKDKARFRQFLNASYKEGGVVQRAKKVRSKEEDNYEIETFEPYKPIAMANISGIEDVLGDRCITIILQKSINPLKTKKIEDFEKNYTIQNANLVLRRAECSLCSVVTKKNIIQHWNEFITTQTPLTTHTTLTTLTTLFNKINESDIDGRNLELIMPLLLTANLISYETFEEILEVCKGIIVSKKEDELANSPDVQLIDFVANAYDESQLNFVAIRDVVNHFRGYLNEVDDMDDKWLNSKWMGRALKRLDLILSKRRLGRGNEVMLDVKKAKEKLKMFQSGSDNTT